MFLFSVFMILAGLGSAVWLIVSGQALTMDGLFLLLTALLVALVQDEDPVQISLWWVVLHTRAWW